VNSVRNSDIPGGGNRDIILQPRNAWN
jgi:hypothetical protein